MNCWMRLQLIHLLGEFPWPPHCGGFLSQRRIQAVELLTRLESRVYAALLLDVGSSNGLKSTDCMTRNTPPRTV